MNIAIRYYSRSGNTRALAEAIAKGAGVPALSVDAPDAAIREPVDLLYLGGALYAYGLDAHIKDFLKTLDKAKVKKAVVFSTSWISRHALELLKKAWRRRGSRWRPKPSMPKTSPARRSSGPRRPSRGSLWHNSAAEAAR